jgi:tetraacyldisaccharide 4'-kinase
MGGSGKSPVVAHVARVLQQMRHKPAVLSRGYARPRQTDGAVVVSDGTRVLADYEIAGDEPLMLARQLPGCAVIVCPDRFLAGAVAERRLACTVHVLDDGFQHLQLNRALDIVVVRRRDLEDRVMPFGRLREPLSAIATAHAAVVDADEHIAETVARLGAPRVFSMSRRLGDAGRDPAFAFAGIGQPQEFFGSLRAAGWSVVGSVAFADHHRYSASDLARLGDRARSAGARVLVTTEKDAARLSAVDLGLPLIAVSLTVTVTPADDFAALLAHACSGGVG